MNKKLAIILTLMITSTTALVGCGNKDNIASSTNSNEDTTFEVSSIENGTSDASSEEDNNSGSTDVNNKSENKTTQSSKSNDNSTAVKKSEDKEAASKKPEDTNKSKETNSTTQKENKPAAKKATTYTAKAGYQLTFPASWEGKYVIEEKADSLTVNYKCSKDKTSENPYLFSIEKFNPNESYDYFDRVGNIRTFDVGNTKYIVGGPTDIRLGEDSKDFKDYIAINRQSAEVVNSIKVIK